MFRALKRWLLGSPLPSAHAIHERLTKVVALAVFSSDALSSVAYATQEILHQLVLAGTSGYRYAVPIAGGIAILLAIVAMSYSQTIRAYATGGGSYLVAKDNLGVTSGLVAAAALLIDYILTVAVSSAAGVAAVTSAIPRLYEHRTALCILCVITISVMNLRGIRESGRIFAVPTYLFIGAFTLLLLGAFTRLATGKLAPLELPPAAHELSHPLTVWLLLRAFAAGCTALTGVEAIADGVPAFQKPESRNASVTLAWMASICCVFFLGSSYLSVRLQAWPHEAETVISQIARAVFHGGLLYYFVQATTALILILAVNTAFADFPRLASILARDRFVPRQFANQGDRLVFSNGIVFLAGSAIVLLVIFRGSTHALLPLYAVGVFLSFTLSQGGMVFRHLRLKEPGWRFGIVVNATGAVCTSLVLAVITATKFTHGAWVVIVLIPVFVFLFRRVNVHYRQIREQLSLENAAPPAPLRNIVIVPVSTIHRGVVHGLQYARALSDDVRAVVIDLDPEATQRLRERWSQYGCGVPLVVLESPYRSIVRPLLEYIRALDRRSDKDVITVVLPEFVPAHWWEHLLHNQTALLIKGALLFRPNTIVTSVPYHLQRPTAGQARPAVTIGDRPQNAGTVPDAGSGGSGRLGSA